MTLLFDGVAISAQVDQSACACAVNRATSTPNSVADASRIEYLIATTSLVPAQRRDTLSRVPRRLVRPASVLLVLAVVVAMAWGLHAEGGVMDIKGAIPLYAAGLFVCCMFFHGELAAMKPAPRYLTTYYLMISLGGALGSLVIGFVAPKVFNTHYEFGIGLVITLAVAAYLTWRLPRIVPLAAVATACFAGSRLRNVVAALCVAWLGESCARLPLHSTVSRLTSPSDVRLSSVPTMTTPPLMVSRTHDDM